MYRNLLLKNIERSNLQTINGLIGKSIKLNHYEILKSPQLSSLLNGIDEVAIVNVNPHNRKVLIQYGKSQMWVCVRCLDI